MSETKGAIIRQRILDNCLKSERGYSTSEMMERCNDELRQRGYPEVTATNTIRDDKLEIENAYGIEIEELRYGRNVRYRYKDRDFSIYKAPINEKDLLQLKEALRQLMSFEGRPQFEWISELSERIETTLSVDAQQNEVIAEYDNNPHLKGRNFFMPLFNAIKEKKALSIHYQDFKHDEERVYEVSPYFLKQYNKRWFLFAKSQLYDNLTNFALDRINSIEPSLKGYEENNGKFDFSSIFQHTIGVSTGNGNVEDIVIRINKSLYPYISTKPLHPSQTFIGKDDDAVTIKISVTPNYELEQLLLSYGEGITILSPASLREKMKARLEKNLKNYQ
ncbi:MAG: WYL domain-containing protein [Paludibacteraceae bacterium]|nr:WYL domain-containing protein [Paludibacteraceae bacterium]